MEQIEILVENPEQGIANYEPLKAWALDHVSTYKGLVVNPDAIKEAKTLCASLRKLAKAASDMRVKIKKEHEAKIATVTAQLTEITGIFNSAATEIDDQVKAYDKRRQEEKQREIEQIYTEEIGDLEELLPLARISSPSWLNKSTTAKTIRSDMQATVINAREALKQIRALGSKHEAELIAAYLERLNLADALTTKSRLEETDAMLAKRDEQKHAEEIMQRATEAVEVVPVPNVVPPAEAPATPSGETFDFAFVVTGCTQDKVDALVAFLENGGYTYALEL